MSTLAFTALDVTPERYAAVPTLLFRLRITETTGATVHAIALRTQLRIEPQRRRYAPAEVAGLVELFGGADRFGDTLKPFLWTHAATMVRGFTGTIDVELPVPCSYDLEVAAGKYFHALWGGRIPLVLLFSGTVFTRGATGFTVEQVPWHLEADCPLPVATWRELMDSYFPNAGWLRLDRATLAALSRFRAERGLTTWEQTFDVLLAPQGVRS